MKTHPSRLHTHYLVLCLLGIALPCWQFVPWLLSNGLNPALFFHDLFANRISGFFAADVIVSAVVLLVFIGSEGRRAGVRGLWAPVVGTLLVGVSFGLPLFLYLRERQRNESSQRASEQTHSL